MNLEFIEFIEFYELERVLRGKRVLGMSKRTDMMNALFVHLW